MTSPFPLMSPEEVITKGCRPIKNPHVRAAGSTAWTRGGNPVRFPTHTRGEMWEDEGSKIWMGERRMTDGDGGRMAKF